MSELERALVLLLRAADRPFTAAEKLEVEALLFTIAARAPTTPYHATYRGAHALEKATAELEGREPVLISHDAFITGGAN